METTPAPCEPRPERQGRPRPSAPPAARPTQSRRRGALRALTGAALAPALLATTGAHARTDRTPIRLLVGFPPGGTVALLAHLIADAMREDLGTPVIVDSRPGAGGKIAALGDFSEYHEARRLRVIGVVARERSLALPEVPTFVEQGHRIDWEHWIGLFAPAGTPGPTIERLHDAVAGALARRAIRERLSNMVMEPASSPPERLFERVRAGLDYWAPVVRDAGRVPQ